jgi:hypothetical protein
MLAKTILSCTANNTLGNKCPTCNMSCYKKNNDNDDDGFTDNGKNIMKHRVWKGKKSSATTVKTKGKNRVKKEKFLPS